MKPICCLLVLSLLGAGSAFATPRYVLTDLGDLAGGDDYSRATGLNDSGVVVGYSSRNEEHWSAGGAGSAAMRATMWRNGQSLDLGTGSSVRVTVTLLRFDPVTGTGYPVTKELFRGYLGSSYAMGINNSGDVVVRHGQPGIGQWEFLPAGEVERLRPHGSFIWQDGETTVLDFFPTAIGSEGSAVGFTSIKPVSEAGGETTDLDALPRSSNLVSVDWGVPASVPYAVNASGTVVGKSNGLAVAWNADGSAVDLMLSWPPEERRPLGCPSYPGVIYACNSQLPGFIERGGVATSINDTGTIVGTSYRGSFLMAAGSVQFIDGISPLDINNQDVVVGSWSSGGVQDAMIWSADAGSLSLDGLVIDAAGWDLVEAVAINERGQIAVNGVRDGISHALLLTPVPEAETWAMLLAGLGLLGLVSRKRIG